MRLTRRAFLDRTIAVAAGAAIAAAHRSSAATSPYRAVVFDAFPIFDPRPVGALAEAVFPGKGAELAAAWRTRQFEYQWLRALSTNYADFWKTTEDALTFACASLDLDLDAPKRDRLMHAWVSLKAWPDVPAALAALRRAGLRLAFLSNMTRSMLDANVSNAGLAGAFDDVLSTDQIRGYKPDPRAYRLAMETLRLERGAILFVAFAGWDAAGAKTFGYPTFWLNRQHAPKERLDAEPDAIGASMAELVEFVERSAR